MILRKIELRSFRQFREADVTFDLGTIAITGENGSGKTTLLEAVKFALYGDCRGKKPEIANIHHGGKPSAAIEFELNAVHYRCERNLNDAAMYRLGDDEPTRIAYSLNGVSDYSEKLLGLTAEQFCNSYMTEQKEIEFLKFAKSRQQEQIAQMLGIEVLATAAKKAKELNKASGAALLELQAVMESKAVLEAELLEKETACEQRKIDLSKAELEVAECENKLQELAPLNDLATELIGLVTRTRHREDVGRTLKAECAELKKQLEQCEADVAEFKALEPVSIDYARLSAKHVELSGLRSQLSERDRLVALRDAKQESYTELKKELDPAAQEAEKRAADQLAKVLRRQEELRTQSEDAIAKWREQQRIAHSSLEALRAEHARLTTELSEALDAEAKGVCPTCGQKMPDGHAPRSIALGDAIDSADVRISEAQAVAEQLANEPSDVASIREQLKSAVQASEEANKQHLTAAHAKKLQEALAAKLQVVTKEIGDLEARIDKCPTTFDQSAFDQLSQQIAELDAPYKRFMQLSSALTRASEAKSRYEAKTRQFDEERAQQDLDKKRISEIGINETRAREIQSQYVLAHNTLPHLKQQVAACSDAVTVARKGVEEASARIAKWQENAERMEGHRHERDLYGAVSEAMADLRSHLNSLIRPTLSTFAGEALGIITDNRYTKVEIDSSFNAWLHDGEHRKNVISGGEEDVLALALRIALSRYVQEKSGHALSLLVLDEVFGSLDANRRANVLEWLNGLKAMFPQIIFISHVDGLTEAADRVLKVEYDRTKKESIVTEDYGAQLVL